MRYLAALLAISFLLSCCYSLRPVSVHPTRRFARIVLPASKKGWLYKKVHLQASFYPAWWEAGAVQHFLQRWNHESPPWIHVVGRSFRRKWPDLCRRLNSLWGACDHFGLSYGTRKSISQSSGSSSCGHDDIGSHLFLSIRHLLRTLCRSLELWKPDRVG